MTGSIPTLPMPKRSIDTPKAAARKAPVIETIVSSSVLIHVLIRVLVHVLLVLVQLYLLKCCSCSVLLIKFLKVPIRLPLRPTSNRQNGKGDQAAIQGVTGQTKSNHLCA